MVVSKRLLTPLTSIGYGYSCRSTSAAAVFTVVSSHFSHVSTSRSWFTNLNCHRDKSVPKRVQNVKLLSTFPRNKIGCTLLPAACPSESASMHTSTTRRSSRELSPDLPQPTVHDGLLSLSYHDKAAAVEVPLVWLRDHCRCPKCFNNNTSQKILDHDLMQRDLSDVTVTIDETQRSFVIEWKDDHTSTFAIKELEEWFYPGIYRQHTRPVLWDNASLRSHGIPSVPYHEHINTESGLKQSLRNLVTFGFTFVDETPVTLEATQMVSERIGKIMPTLFGDSGVWTLTSESEDFKDTAYSNIALGAHTDLTYYHSAAGIQVFHGVKHTGSGGETLLVDGFHAANILREKHPESFECLTSCVVPHQYLEPVSDKSPGYHLYNLCHVLTTHPNSRELIQIRFNPYDRAPLNTLPPGKIEDFYKAYDRLSRIIADTSNELWIPLSPGRVILIDNWRVMHGRAAFTGLRTLVGCYLQRDEWISKARYFHLF